MLLVGASVVPIVSVGLAFSVELAFPVPEVITNGTMITFSLLWGTGLGIAGSTLATKSVYYPLLLWAITSLLGLILSFFVDQDLRRLQLDDVKNSEYIEEEEIRRYSFE
jgi:hypothetical protein